MSDNFNPLVSIVIPVYNGSNYMREAIDSALTQTYKNIEVLVINDGSCDEGKTREIALSYGDKIRYFEKENGGVSTALNRGIKEMRGEYFSWLSHDDVYYPEKINYQIEYLKKLDDKICALYSNFDYIDENSKIIGQNSFISINPEKFQFKLISSYPIHGCTTLISKDCFKNVDLFDENLKVIQDCDLWFKISNKYNFYHIPEVLIKSRIHKNQGTQKLTIENILEYENTYRFFLKNLKIKNLKCNEIIDLYLGLSKKCAGLSTEIFLTLLKNKQGCIQVKIVILFLEIFNIFYIKILKINKWRHVVKSLIYNLYILIYNLICKYFPSQNSPNSFGVRLRYFFLKKRFGKCGRMINIQPGVNFYNIKNIEIGDFSGIGRNSTIFADDKIHIGNNVMIGQELIIHTSNHNINREFIMIKQGSIRKPVTIGNDVWIGSRVTILSGVTIGDGVVIGAGSVVTKNLEPYWVYAGVPAKKIKERQ